MNGVNPQPPVESSPSGHRNGPPPPTRPRRKPPANPLVATRRPAKPKPQSTKASGAQSSNAQKPRSQLSANASTPTSAKSAAPIARTEAFTQRPPSPPPEGVLQTFPVVTTKRELIEGLRYHIARLQSKDLVDVTDEKAFTRPVRLHRRDPASRSVKSEPATPDPETTAKDELEEKERERLDAIKQENKRIREENQKQIAPTAAVLKKKQMLNKKKTQQVYRPNDTAEEQKKSQLRYEEAFPWHIEDDDNRQTWMGAFESTLSDCHLMFIMEKDNRRFRVVPLEKFYKFKEKGKTKQLDIETVNELMTKKSKEPRFIMLKRMEIEKKSQQKELASHRRFAKKGGVPGAGARVKRNDDEGDSLFTNPDVQEGDDGVDFDNDELFDDDDADPLFDEDDEAEARNRLDKIKKEQLEANVFDLIDENDVEAEEEKKARQAEFKRKADKKIRRALLKREKNYNYEDDSEDENPYSSGSEEEESSQEGEGEDQKSPEKTKNGVPGSIKGDTTPSDRKKGPDGTAGKSSFKRAADVEMSEASGNESSRLKKTKLNPNLKRPGSPDVSGASGNESSRKKQKLGTSLKVAPNRQVSALRGTAGSGSESESSKRVKGVRPGSSQATPSGSRAQSPAGRAVGSGPGSRSASPAAGDMALPTAEETLAAIPPVGITLRNLLAKFPGRIGTQQVQAFTVLVRSIAQFDKSTHQISRKQ